MTFSHWGVTVGSNIIVGRRPSGTDYQVYRADVLIDKGKLLWKNEAFFTTEEDGNENRTAFYRYDYLDAGAGETTENVVGLAFKPNRNVHLRTILRNKHFDAGFDGLTSSEDAQIYQLSATHNF